MPKLHFQIKIGLYWLHICKAFQIKPKKKIEKKHGSKGVGVGQGLESGVVFFFLAR